MDERWNITLPYEETNPTMCNRMDGGTGYYAQRNKSRKDKCQLIALTCGVSEKRKGLTEQDSSCLSVPKNGPTVTKGNVTEEDGLGGREERENGALRGAHTVWPAACMGKAE